MWENFLFLETLVSWSFWAVILWGLGVFSVIHVLFSMRSSEGTMAWVIALLAMPLMALPAYWLFGRNRFQGYVRARQLSSSAFKQVFKGLGQSPQFCEADLNKREEAKYSVLSKIADFPFSVENNVTLLTSGSSMFAALCKIIDDAKAYVLLQFYIIRDDEVGGTLRKHLTDALARGVRVYFLYDSLGSFQLPKNYMRTLQDAGAETRAFHKKRGRIWRGQFNFRNHRKMVVVDGEVFLSGGSNIGEEYVYKTKRFGLWRDTHILCYGPATLGAQLAFLEDWYFFFRNSACFGLAV